ncbi:MAG: efflux RND transporter periplasmic adaptor subunit [Endomicrobiia bacterium]|nr:MAG: efflux RND transporter periplasmic adaptor subunit [Endomicrobiia bacterium]
MVKNKKKIFYLCLIVVLFLIAIIVFKPSKQFIDGEETLKSRDLYEVFRESGVICPRNRVVIRSPLDGRIEEICVNEGDIVKKGQIVFWMSSVERASMMDAVMIESGLEEYKKWGSIFEVTPVLAPMNGFIIRRSKEPKQTVSFKDEILVMADDLIVCVDINEVDLKYIKIGSKLIMCLDAYPEKQFEGVVEHISYEAKYDNNVTLYTVKVRPLTKMDTFRSGMNVTITILARYKRNALSIPVNFISEKERKNIVVVKKGNLRNPVFDTREVKTGLSDGKFTEIVSGLNTGEIVVTFKSKPNHNLRNINEMK